MYGRNGISESYGSPLMQPHRNSRSDDSGFSLVELLVVMAIVGLLMVAAVSHGTSWGDSASERGAASQVAGALDRARAHAIATDGYAAFVVAGPEAGEKAWRQVAVVAIREDPQNPAFPFALGDALDTPGVVAPEDPIDMVMPWTDLPQGMIAFGRLHGATLESAVDDPGSLKVPTVMSGAAVACKVVVFNGQGAVVYPEQKTRRLVRVGPGDGEGGGVVLLESQRAEAMPAVTIERFTGRIRVVR